MTANDLLDDILSWFAFNQNAKPGATLDEIGIDYHERNHSGESLMFLGNLIENVVSKAVKKLEKDGYVEIRTVYRDYGNQYTVTLEGLVFIQSGGYKRQASKERNKLAINRLEKTILTGGATFAGIYSVVEILDYLSDDKKKLLIVPVLTTTVIFLFGVIAGCILYKLTLREK